MPQLNTSLCHIIIYGADLPRMAFQYFHWSMKLKRTWRRLDMRVVNIDHLKTRVTNIAPWPQHELLTRLRMFHFLYRTRCNIRVTRVKRRTAALNAGPFAALTMYTSALQQTGHFTLYDCSRSLSLTMDVPLPGKSTNTGRGGMYELYEASKCGRWIRWGMNVEHDPHINAPHPAQFRNSNCLNILRFTRPPGLFGIFQGEGWAILLLPPSHIKTYNSHRMWKLWGLMVTNPAARNAERNSQYKICPEFTSCPFG